jgi:hydroxymethylpyrimidine/phosphomethylpyrimidine kinase
MRKVLTIAGSDSGAGAGIQADLKTLAALKVYGMCAITAITAQNTLGVKNVQVIPPQIVGEQIDAVVEDLGVDAVKTGMLANTEIIKIVAQKVKQHKLIKLVVDPVMMAKSGDKLLEEEAILAYKKILFPLSLIVTPNLDEAGYLVGSAITSVEEMKEAARRLHQLGPRYVLVKGGHLPGQDATDILFDGSTFFQYSSPRIFTKHTHGTGCTFAAAIAAWLALGAEVPEAVKRARDYLQQIMQAGLELGKGCGPLHHMYPYYPVN